MTEQQKATTKFRILSLDGGGMRGVASAKILEEVEKIIQEECSITKLNEYFDLIVGTSTGSILAAGIAGNRTAKELLDLYKENGKNIFLPSVRKLRKAKFKLTKSNSNSSEIKFSNSSFLGLQNIVISLLKSFQTKKYPIGVQGDKFSADFWENLLFGIPLYPHKSGSKGLAKVLQKKLFTHEQGKNKQVNKLTMCDIKKLNKADLLIPAYDVYSRNTTWFANDDETEWYYKSIKLWEICTASSSAPLLFPPYKMRYTKNEIRLFQFCILAFLRGAQTFAICLLSVMLWLNWDASNKGKQYLPHIDGGVSLADPELAGIAYAVSRKDSDDLKIEEIAILCIGTGRSTRPYKHKEMKKWKIQDFVQNILTIFLYPSTENSGYISHRMFLGMDKKKRLRLDFELNKQLKGEPKEGVLRQRLSKKYSYNEYIWEDLKSQPDIEKKIDKLYDELKQEKKAKYLKKINEKNYNQKITELEKNKKFNKKLLKIKKEAKVSEEIDDYKISKELEYAAKCYLKYGKIKVDNKDTPVTSVIRDFIKSNAGSLS